MKTPRPRRSSLSIQDPSAARRRVYRDATHAAGWGLLANILLAALKIGGGLLTGSVALLADAVNSLGDIASAVAVGGALHVAQQDEDDEHPYGHTKAESIAGLSIALLVVFSAAMLGVETIRQFGQTSRPPLWAAAAIAATCALTKEILYQTTRRVARRLRSTSLQAVAWDHRGDALASSGIAIALALAPLAGAYASLIDPIAAIVVCLVLIVVGLRLFARTAAELMDQQADPTLTGSIRETAEHVPQAEEIEKLRVRKSGLEYFVEIHVRVDGHLTVSEGHRIGHSVKDAIMLNHPRIRDVHVHIEPHEPTTAEV